MVKELITINLKSCLDTLDIKCLEGKMINLERKVENYRACIFVALKKIHVLFT